jgi:hypothetical protein
VTRKRRAWVYVWRIHRSNFDIYLDHWNEQSLYFGNYGNQLMDIDKMFSSEKFKNQITAAGTVDWGRWQGRLG